MFKIFACYVKRFGYNICFRSVSLNPIINACYVKRFACGLIELKETKERNVSGEKARVDANGVKWKMKEGNDQTWA